MEIKTKKTIEQTVNLELPYYSKSGAHYYKIISPIESLVVCDFLLSIQCYSWISEHSFGADSIKITEEEFINAFILVQGKLNAKLI